MAYYFYGVDSLRAFQAQMRISDGAAFDMESVGEEVIGLGIGNDEVACYASGDEHVVRLLDTFKFLCGPRIAHSAQADLRALGAVEAADMYPLYDTMVAASLLPGWGEGVEYGFLNLSFLSQTVLGRKLENYDSILSRFRAADLGGVPEREVAWYNISQVRATYSLYKKFAENFSSQPQLKGVFDLEMQILPILAMMEETGIQVDRKRLLGLQHRFEEEGASLQLAVADLTQGQIKNVNSPKQVTEYLFGKEDGQIGAKVIYKSKRTGKPSANERVIKKLLEKDPDSYSWLRILLRAREIQKLVGTYCKGIARGLDWEGRSHSHLSQVTTETGRLASKNPNHQNIPKRRAEGLDIRRCFVAPEGSVLIAADMDQLELRLLAEEASETKMQEAFHSGEDIHLKTAIEILGDPKERFKAKVLNYTIVYLAGAQQIGDQTKVSAERAQMMMDSYFRKYWRLTEWIREWDELCRGQGYVETWLGRRRDVSRFYDQPGKSFKRGSSGGKANDWITEGTRKAVNTRIQGTAAEVLKLAMVRVDKQLKERGLASRMLMQIHDEILLEAPIQEVEEAVEVLKLCMTTSYGEMPLPCTVKVGPNWADVK